MTPPVIYGKGGDATISGSCTLIKGLPRIRMVQLLEKLQAELAAGFPSQLSQRGLLIMLRMMTGLRPWSRIMHLHAWANALFTVTSILRGSK